MTGADLARRRAACDCLTPSRRVLPKSSMFLLAGWVRRFRGEEPDPPESETTLILVHCPEERSAPIDTGSSFRLGTRLQAVLCLAFVLRMRG